MNCIFDRYSTYTYFLIASVVVVPFCLIIFFYSKIFIKIRSLSRDRTYLEGPLRVINGLFASCVLFLISYGPYGVVVFTDVYHTFPKEVHIYTMGLLHLNSLSNPFLYLITNSPIRDGYANFFNLIFRTNSYKYR